MFHQNVSESLVQSDTSPNHHLEQNDQVPLVVAAQTGDIDAVCQLIENPDIDLNTAGLHEETALHMACAVGYPDIVTFLVNAGANVDITDKEGSTPLTHCARFCPPHVSGIIAEILLKAGANPTKTLSRDTSMSPLQWAICFSNIPVAEALLPVSSLERTIEQALSAYRGRKTISSLVFLLDRGVSPTSSDLHSALKCGSWEVFDLVKDKLALSPDGFQDFAVAALDDLLYESILTPGFTIDEVGGRLFRVHNVDPNYKRIAEVVVASGSAELLEHALEFGLDLKNLDEAEVYELVTEAQENRRTGADWAVRIAGLRK